MKSQEASTEQCRQPIFYKFRKTRESWIVFYLNCWQCRHSAWLVHKQKSRQYWQLFINTFMHYYFVASKCVWPTITSKIRRYSIECTNHLYTMTGNTCLHFPQYLSSISFSVSRESLSRPRLIRLIALPAEAVLHRC